MIKFAQFFNEEQLKKDLSRLKPRELTEYVSILSQIHSDLKTGNFDSVEDVVSSVVGDEIFESKFLRLINSIGLAYFESAQFSEIENKINEIAAPAVAPTLEPNKIDLSDLSIPGMDKQTPTEKIPGVDSDDTNQDDTNQDDVTVDVSSDEMEFNFQSLDEKLATVKSRDYSAASEKIQAEVQRNLNNLDDLNASYNSNVVPKAKKEQIYSLMEEILDDLNEIYTKIQEGTADAYFDDGDIDDGDIDVTDLDQDEVKKKVYEANPELQAFKSKDGKEISLERGVNSKKYTEITSSDIKSPEDSDGSGFTKVIGNHFEMQNATTNDVALKIFDITQDPPVFDQSGIYETVLNTAKFKLMEINESIEKLINLEQTRVSGANLAKDINDIINELKVVDIALVKQMSEYKRQAALAGKSKSAVTKVSIGFTERLNTEVLKEDFEFFEKFIFRIVTWLSNPVLAKTLFSRERDRYMPNVRVNGVDQPADIVSDSYYSWAVRATYQKYKASLRISTSDFYSSLDNFVLSTKVHSSHVFNKVVASLKGTPAFEKKVMCPTCSKEITWSYDSSIKDVMVDAPGGTTKGLRARGIKIQLYSVFRRTPNKDGLIPITLADTVENGVEIKFAPPALPSDLNERDPISVEQANIWRNMSGDMTWSEIDNLIYSNNRASHFEGLIRRHSALKDLGGIPAGMTYSKSGVTRTSRAVRGVSLSNVMHECPFPTGDATGGCGLAYAGDSEDVFNLQPTESLTGDKWDSSLLNDNVRESAEKRTAGGYKFSKTMFCCPTYFNPNDDIGINRKHFRMAISSVGPAGSAGYVPPLDPTTGSAMNIPENTLSYMVCGANTSISSFDRSSDSESYIINVLQRIKTQNESAYVKILDFFVRNGVDVSDVMYISSAIMNRPFTVGAKSSRDRLEKISAILKEAQEMNFSDPELSAIRDLFLVCPHGHKFTIGQSIDFNATHSGTVIRSTVGDDGSFGGFRNYEDILFSTGNDNIRAMVEKGIIKKFKNPNPESYGFEKFNEGVPLVKTYFEVIEDGQPVHYVFTSATKRTVKKNVFGSPSATSMIPDVVSRIIDPDAVRTIRIADVSGPKSESATLANDLGNIAESAREMYHSDGEKAEVIPGVDPATEDPILDRHESLINAIRATVKVVHTWTKGVANSNLARVLLFVDNDAFSGYASDIATEFVNNGLVEFYRIVNTDSGRQKIGVTNTQNYINLFSRTLSDQLVKSADYHGLFEGDLSVESARTIITNTVFESIRIMQEDHDLNELDPTDDVLLQSSRRGVMVSFSREDGENFINSYIEQKNLEAGKKNPTVDQTFARIGNEKKKTFVQGDYRTRIVLHSYALNIIDSLIRINSSFLQRTSNEYIGYDIGLDLSSLESIMGLTDADFNSDAVVNPKIMITDDYVIDMCARNIDRCYEELKFNLKTGIAFAESPSALIKSKSMIQERIKRFVPEEKEGLIPELIDAAFPTTILEFNQELNPENFIPLPSRDESTFFVPGKMPGTIEVDGVIINEAFNYRSDRFQVGMVSPKPRDGAYMNWPMQTADIGDIGVVGIHVPMNIGRGKKIDPIKTSRLSSTYIDDFNIIVDVGENTLNGTNTLDITPFFKRGRDEAQSMQIKDLRRNLIATIERVKRDIKLARAKGVKKSIIHERKLEANSIIRQYHAAIKNIPPLVRTKASLLRQEALSGNYDTAAFAALILIEPYELVELLDYPYLIFPDIDYVADEVSIKNFFSNAYKLDTVLDVYNSTMGTEHEIDAMFSKSFYDEIFASGSSSDGSKEKKEFMKFRKELMNRYHNSVGTYYDVISSSTDIDEDGNMEREGSYISYLSDFIPDIELDKKGLVTIKETKPKYDYEEVSDLILRVSKSSTKINDALAKIPDFLINYLYDSTRGEFKKRSSIDSEFIKNSFDRLANLEDVMIALGLYGIYID